MNLFVETCLSIDCKRAKAKRQGIARQAAMSGRTEARQSRVRALLAEGGFYEMEEQARRPPPPPPITLQISQRHLALRALCQSDRWWLLFGAGEIPSATPNPRSCFPLPNRFEV